MLDDRCWEAIISNLKMTLTTSTNHEANDLYHTFLCNNKITLTLKPAITQPPLSTPNTTFTQTTNESHTITTTYKQHKKEIGHNTTKTTVKNPNQTTPHTTPTCLTTNNKQPQYFLLFLTNL